MPEHTFENAVAALQEHIGGQYEGTRDEGRRKMMKVLTDRLGYSHGDARDTLEALTRSGRIRYVTADNDRRASDAADMPPAPVAVAGNNTGGAGVPAIPTTTETVPAPGYWEIGAPEADENLGIRKGQVRPAE